MDGGRYMLQQSEWDNSSALESYDAIHDSDLRTGSVYGGRGGYLEREFEKESGYLREPYSRDILYEREIFGMTPTVIGLWPPTKRHNVEDELALIREVHRNGKAGLADTFRDYRFDSVARCSRDRDSYDGDDPDYIRRSMQGSREDSKDVELDFLRYRGYDSERERSRRGRDWRQRKRRGWNRSRSRDRNHDWSPQDPDCNRDQERSRSVSYEERSRRSRSHRSRSNGWREDSFEDVFRKEETVRSERRREREGRSSHQERPVLAPSATLVVKGLSQKTVEDDLYHALADWGPLKHVRVIKERNSGVSRGFAFVDFPSMEAAQRMMDGVGFNGLVVDGRRLFFEYSKPTGGSGILQGGGSGRGGCVRSAAGIATDWMCTVCGCVNFARRTLCFQCNEGKAEDAPAADVQVSMVTASNGRRSSEAGPTHVLVVRGLDENVSEEVLHCEFSKYAPIKDLRLVRDKFTQVSRGFAFIHFNSVQEAAKTLEASNGTVLENNGQLLRVAFAKSIYGSGSSAPCVTQAHGSQAAVAAIEAATFAQQYDNTGWAPKEYNPDQDLNNGYKVCTYYQSTHVKAGEGVEKGYEKSHSYEAQYGGQGDTDMAGSGENKPGTPAGAEGPQSGFVWDAASGYYYDAASGFYYDGHRGLYYDGNTGLWYTYDQESQQYEQFVDPVMENKTDVIPDVIKPAADKVVGFTNDGNVNSKAVISAPASVSLEMMDKKPTLAEAVIQAAVAAQVAAKKEKERMKEKEKETRLAGKGPLMVSKKKISSAMNQWKQRQTESQTVQGVVSDATSIAPASGISDVRCESISSTAATYSGITSHQTSSSRFRFDNLVKDSLGSSLGRGGSSYAGAFHTSEGSGKAKPSPSNISPMNSKIWGLTIGNAAASFSSGGLGRGSKKGAGRGTMESEGSVTTMLPSEPVTTTPFKTNASALGSYGPMAGIKRRFTETPQTGYRDRAAERRNLHGSSVRDEKAFDFDPREKGPGVKVRGLDMPFPPGVGTKSGANGILASPEAQSFEVISAEKALDERNVGNRMLRNMGWQEGLGLGKEGTGIVEPVQAHGTGERAGLGSSSQRKLDSRFETQPGDTYRVVIQKKALARFHEMI